MDTDQQQLVRVKHEIELYDIDSFGVVHFSRHSSLMEKVCFKLLNQLGITVSGLDEKGKSLVIRETKIKYLSPATYEDDLTLEASILKKGNCRIIISSNIYKDDTIITKGELDFVCVEKSNGNPAILFN